MVYLVEDFGGFQRFARVVFKVVLSARRMNRAGYVKVAGQVDDPRILLRLSYSVRHG
jgi:hypothetical protein